MSVPAKPRHFSESPLCTTVSILLFAVFFSPDAARSQETIRPLPDGPWENAAVKAQLQEPQKESFFQKLIPGSKKSSAGQTQLLPAPEPEPEHEPERNPVSVWVEQKLKRDPNPKPEPEPAPEKKSGSPFGWFQRDPEPAPLPEPQPAPASDSRSIFGWFKSEPAPAPGTAPDIRFEPRADPPAATVSTQPESRDFGGWLPGRGTSQPEPPRTAETAPSSGGFLSRFGLMNDTQSEPATPAATAPVAESKSGGFFGLFKDKPSEPEPVVAETPTDSDSGGFFGLFKDKPSEPEPVVAEAATEADSGGFFGLFKGKPSEPEPVVAETPAEADSGGFFSFKNPWKSTGSQPDPAPEVTLEVDPEPDSDSAGLLSRFKRQPAEKSPSPAPAFSEKPVSDATVEAALAAKPAADSSSSGFLSKILPGGGNAPADTSEAVDKKRPEPPPVLAATEPDKRTVHFESDIKPIFESKCVTCHNRDTLHGRVSLESRALAFADTPAGRVIVPGSPDSSLLFQNVISARTTERTMPPTGHSITRKEKDLIYTWIKEGAYWPEGSSGRLVAY